MCLTEKLLMKTNHYQKNISKGPTSVEKDTPTEIVRKLILFWKGHSRKFDINVSGNGVLRWKCVTRRNWWPTIQISSHLPFWGNSKDRNICRPISASRPCLGFLGRIRWIDRQSSLLKVTSFHNTCIDKKCHRIVCSAIKNSGVTQVVFSSQRVKGLYIQT